MISLKIRGHRSSSTNLTSSTAINKENTSDANNRLLPLVRKPTLKPVLRHVDSKLTETTDNNSVVSSNAPLTSRTTLEKKRSVSPNFKSIENSLIARDYGTDILKTLKQAEVIYRPKDILNQHQISRELRAKMVDWMIEVLSSYKFSQQAFFAAVRIMDTFFMKTPVPHKSSELHLTGVASIFMACKYEEIYPLKLKVIYEKIAHKKLSKEEIVKKESEILSVLEFKMVGVSNYDLAMQALYESDFESLLEPKLYAYLTKICLYLCKMVMFDSILYTDYDYSVLAAAAIYVSFKIIEQVDSSFNPDFKIKPIANILGVKDSLLFDCAARVLAMAKSFDRTYPSLSNLRKFNGFSFSTEGCSTERLSQD